MYIKNNLRFYSFIMIGLFLMLTYSCKKEKKESPVPETGTVKDIDGNVYKTIKIGGQWWMAENLKVKTYRNGRAILQAQTDGSWKNATGAYCTFDNASANALGLLYNWYAVSDTNNIAPTGWHVPSDDEWKELEYHLGMQLTDIDKTSWRGTHEGEKMKIAAPKGWTKYNNVWATNESGFTALAGACRLPDGTLGNPGLFCTGFWWCLSLNGTEAWYRHLDYKNANVFRYYGSKNYGFSVRCVKD